jgi:hypothetical protein
VDLTQPINVAAVNNTRVEYGNVLKSLNMFSVAEILKDCTAQLGVKSSLVLGKTTHGTISKKYDGNFTGGNTVGTIVARTLTVYPVVAEMLDEPEKYRKMFFADVAGGLWDATKHPFELWLLQHGIKVADENSIRQSSRPRGRNRQVQPRLRMHSTDGLRSSTPTSPPS